MSNHELISNNEALKIQVEAFSQSFNPSASNARTSIDTYTALYSKLSAAGLSRREIEAKLARETASIKYWSREWSFYKAFDWLAGQLLLSESGGSQNTVLSQLANEMHDMYINMDGDHDMRVIEIANRLMMSFDAVVGALAHTDVNTAAQDRLAMGKV
jgi:hypothetical protein